MQVPTTPEAFFASFENLGKSTIPSSNCRSPARLSTPTFDDKLNKHLSSFSANIMTTPDTNNNLITPVISKMRQNNNFTPVMTTISGKTYSKGRQHRKETGGPGRGVGAIRKRIQRDLPGRVLGRGGGGLGIETDDLIELSLIEHDDGIIHMALDDTLATIPAEQSSLPPSTVTPNKMNIDSANQRHLQGH